MDVASRADLKSDLLKDLERHRRPAARLPRQPVASREAALDEVIGRIDHAFNGLNQLPGKAGQALTSNEWLMSIRSRISIPGGTCEFDLPAYYAWQQHRAERRRADLVRLDGDADAAGRGAAGAARPAARLRRAAGMVAAGRAVPAEPAAGRSYQLLRVRIDPAPAWCPRSAATG